MFEVRQHAFPAANFLGGAPFALTLPGILTLVNFCCWPVCPTPDIKGVDKPSVKVNNCIILIKQQDY